MKNYHKLVKNKVKDKNFDKIWDIVCETVYWNGVNNVLFNVEIIVDNTVWYNVKNTVENNMYNNHKPFQFNDLQQYKNNI
jgi:hypothetical protein